jgi:hypothetical protein
MRRREFLWGGAAALGAGGLLRPSLARGAGWATGPEEARAHLLPAGVRAEKALEVFLYGGLAPFESFYTIPEFGRPTDPDYPDQQWYLFADDHEAVYQQYCGLGDAAKWLMPWKPDSQGRTVNLGPIAMPIRQRADLMARMRVIVVRHDLEPHEAAIPYMLSGMRLGNVRMAGMGAHVQRYFLDQGEAGRVAPYSYVLTPENIFSTDNLRAASSVGVHPGAARPLSLTVNSTDTLSGMLSRGHLTEQTRPKVDALLSWYRDQATQRHSAPDGEALRSRALGDHGFSLTSVMSAPELRDVLGADLLAPEGHASCGEEDSVDYNRVGIRAAASLLGNPSDPARYVNVIDTGLDLADGGGGYDTHAEHPYTQAMNGLSMLENLVDHINEPGEGDPSKVDLDETMVLVTTEFGRTPYRQSNNGTNHFPYGFVVLMFGGPIGPDQAGVLGAMGPDAYAIDYVTPSEFRAACLAAMGMYPFAQESFAVGDIRDVVSELDGLVWLTEHVLGRV